MNHPPLRAFLLIPFVLVWLAISPTTRAVCQQGCLTNQNTVLGEDALFSNTGFFNTAIGFNALYFNTTGNWNIAIGDSALFSNTTGSYNTATGFDALLNNSTGSANTATGFDALVSNTTGSGNTATGLQALFFNTTGSANTAIEETEELVETPRERMKVRGVTQMPFADRRAGVARRF